MDKIDVRAFLKQKDEMDKMDAVNKMGYRILAGQALLEDNSLKEKWAKFVKNQTEGFGYGVLLDETIQIMGMIKAGVPTDTIREVLSKIGSYKTVITYLGAFIHPEIMYEIDIDQNVDKAFKNL